MPWSGAPWQSQPKNHSSVSLLHARQCPSNLIQLGQWRKVDFLRSFRNSNDSSWASTQCIETKFPDTWHRQSYRWCLSLVCRAPGETTGPVKRSKLRKIYVQFFQGSKVKMQPKWENFTILKVRFTFESELCTWKSKIITNLKVNILKRTVEKIVRFGTFLWKNFENYSCESQSDQIMILPTLFLQRLPHNSRCCVVRNGRQNNCNGERNKSPDNVDQNSGAEATSPIKAVCHEKYRKEGREVGRGPVQPQTGQITGRIGQQKKYSDHGSNRIDLANQQNQLDQRPSDQNRHPRVSLAIGSPRQTQQRTKHAIERHGVQNTRCTYQTGQSSAEGWQNDPDENDRRPENKRQ